MTDPLRNYDGYQMNRKSVPRLMQFMGIKALFPGSNLSKRYHAQSVRPYLLKDPDMDHPDQVCGVDITYLPLRKGYTCLPLWMGTHVRSWINQL